MSLPKFFLLSTVGLFTVIGVVGWAKKGKEKNVIPVSRESVQEIEFNNQSSQIVAQAPQQKKAPKVKETAKKGKKSKDSIQEKALELPEANYISSFFDPSAIKLPFVETVTYSRRVPWMKGKFAWVSDYATHYKTSKHFIARSLNKKPDYFSQDVKNGDCFNVLRTDKNFHFYLLIDSSLCKMWFYAIDDDQNERILIKTYSVCLGRKDDSKASGSLTPLGKYTLGDKIAVYRPGMNGFFNNQKVEMIQTFGTRWIPFADEVENCTAPAKGLGLHGSPLLKNPATGDYQEDVSGVGKFESDGCIRIQKDEMEELFAIIVSRPTIVEIVKHFHDAKLPGQEKKMD